MVHNVQRVHAQLETESFLDLESSLYVEVQAVEAIRAAVPDSFREHLRLESGWLLGGVRDEPRSIEPAVQRSRTAANLIGISVVKQIAPLEQRTGLPFVSG